MKEYTIWLENFEAVKIWGTRVVTTPHLPMKIYNGDELVGEFYQRGWKLEKSAEPAESS